jgi:hypothetical protein
MLLGVVIRQLERDLSPVNCMAVSFAPEIKDRHRVATPNALLQYYYV